MLRSLSVAVLAAVVLVPLAAAPAAAATSTARSQTAPMSKSVWKNSATRRASTATRTATTSTTTTSVPAPSAATTASPEQSYQDRVLVLTNAERSSRGLAPLALSSCADGFADRWADSLRLSGTLSHQPLAPIMTACAASAAGENVAYGNVTPEVLVEMWMNSAGHRANLLNPSFNRIGVGAVSSSTGRWYGVQVFLRA